MLRNSFSFKNTVGNCPQMTNSDPWLNVWFQKISIPPPWKNIGNSEGEGSQKPKSFLRKYKAKLEIPRREGGGGGANQKLSMGGYGYFLQQQNNNLSCLFCTHTFNLSWFISFIAKLDSTCTALILMALFVCVKRPTNRGKPPHSQMAFCKLNNIVIRSNKLQNPCPW